MDPTPPQPESALAERPQADLSSGVAGLVKTLAKGTAVLTLPPGLSPREFMLLSLLVDRGPRTNGSDSQAVSR